MNQIVQLAQNIIQAYPKAKFYFVGGSVRDKLLNRSIKDYDCVVCGVSAKKLETILKKSGTVNLVGKSFGVYKWRPTGTPVGYEVDIALPREEDGWGTGNRHDFTVQTNENLPIEEDLKRRDFTINAIAFNVLKRRYVDPFSGRADIKKKVIQAVGNPSKRFSEDASRILRALRFSAQLGFTIENNTWNALVAKKMSLFKITKETAASELIKGFSWNPVHMLAALDTSGFLKKLMPEVDDLKKCAQPKEWHSEGNVFLHTQKALEIAAQTNGVPIDPNLVFGILLHDVGKPACMNKRNEKITFYGHATKGAQMARALIARLKLESAGLNKKIVSWLITHHMLLFSSDPNKMKNTTIEGYFRDSYYPGSHLLSLIEADAMASVPKDKKRHDPLWQLRVIKERLSEITKRPRKPLLTGNEIMNICHIKPGPYVGRLLRTLREAELSGKVRTKKQANEFLKKHCV